MSFASFSYTPADRLTRMYLSAVLCATNVSASHSTPLMGVRRCARVLFCEKKKSRGEAPLRLGEPGCDGFYRERARVSAEPPGDDAARLL